MSNIFECLYPKYKITKPIRLIELFAGYGSTRLGLKYNGVEFESWKICEWAIKSIQAYKDLHTNDNTDYSVGLSDDEVIDKIIGISANYNEPLKREQIKRYGFRTIYNNCVATHNLIDISNVKGKDLEIDNNHTYILTYSFPCQDLSLAGKLAGMGEGTRSGLLWQVERILKECEIKPQILLLENVPQIHGKDNLDNFIKWQQELEKMGYSNYWQDLNAKDYEIPQNRNRCFMVSILGEYSFTFPEKKPLKLRLKDLLEDNVNEKYYLPDSILNQITLQKKDDGNNIQIGVLNKYKHEQSDRIYGVNACSPTLETKGTDDARSIKIITNNKALNETLLKNDVKDGDFIDAYNRKVNDNIAGTITTRVSESNNTFIIKLGNYGNGHHAKDITDVEGIMPTITCGNHGTGQAIAIKNATNQGYLLAEDGDGIDISARMKNHRGTVQKGLSQTLKTQIDVGVYVAFSEAEKQLFTPDGNIKRYIGSDIVDEFKEGQMATTTYPNGYGHGPRTHNESIALNTIDRPVVKNNLRIRKLTPKECFRLQGVRDEDSIKIKQSDASLYHLAGDSIVVNVLQEIFKEMIK